MSRILRTLWGTSFGLLPGVQWAKESKPAIWCPALSIYGFSTPDEFHAALQGESVGNGFVNRLLALDMGGRGEDVDPVIDLDAVPAGLTEALSRLYLWSGPASLLSIGTTSIPLEPDVLPWASPQAHAAFKEFSRFVDDEGDRKPDIRDFISRCAETAIRLATIRAAGRWGRGATVDVSDVEWGAGIVWTAAQSMAAGVQGYTPESDRSKGIARMVAWLRRKHVELGRPITRREMQAQEGGNVKTAEFKERFEHMVLAGIIKPEGNGFIPG